MRIKIPNPVQVVTDAAGKAKETVEKAVATGVNIAVAPAKVAVDIAKGRSVKATAKEFAETIKDAATAATEIANTPNFFAINLANEIAGELGAKVAMAAVAGQVIQNSLPAILARYLDKPDLKPGDVLTLQVDVVLAALLDAASKQLKPTTKPIPFMVSALLKEHYPPGTIDGASYAIGKVGITLPEAINGMQTFMGNKAHAVTVPDIIVFSEEPDGSKQAMRWWAHELQHIVQYKTMGVAGFASKYIKHSGEMEAEADAKAASIPLE